MISIEVNVDEVAEAFNLPEDLSDKLMESVISGLTSRLYYLWQKEAQDNLKQTRAEYIQSLTIGNNGPFVGYVALTGQLPLMIEKGASPFDMKEGFKNSSKVKYNSQGGWYLTVPFRHATPEASAFSAGFSAPMPKEIYGEAKILKPKRTGSNFSSGQSLSKSQIPSPFNIPKTRKTIVTKSKIFEEYQHKSSIYEGMIKQSKQYNKVSTGTYMTFRRVGENSDENAFIHPGIKAFNLAEKALQNLDVEHETKIARNTFLNELYK